MEKRQRITYLDMAKGVGIVLMVAGHLLGSLQTIDYKPWFSPVFQVITSFHMPLFFVISGVVLALTHEESKDMRTIVRRKAKTLLLPYASFSVIYIAINIYTYFAHPELIELSLLWKLIVYSLTFHGISVLWFLPTLFFGEILFLAVRKRFDDKRMTFLLVAAGGLMFLISPVFRWEGWEENLLILAVGSLLQVAVRSVLITVFLLVGYLLYPLLQKRQKWSAAELLAGAALLIGCGTLCFANDVVDLNYMVFGNIFLYLICACGSSIGVILLCKNLYQSKILLFIGTNSLVIMATHMEFKVMMHAVQFSYWLNTFVTRAKEWVLFGTIACYMFLAEVIIVMIYKYFLYFLIGKEKPARAHKEEKR